MKFSLTRKIYWYLNQRYVFNKFIDYNIQNHYNIDFIYTIDNWMKNLILFFKILKNMLQIYKWSLSLEFCNMKFKVSIAII